MRTIGSSKSRCFAAVAMLFVVAVAAGEDFNADGPNPPVQLLRVMIVIIIIIIIIIIVVNITIATVRGHRNFFLYSLYASTVS
jgi:hypothetical protein